MSIVQIDWRLACNCWYHCCQVQASCAVALYMLPLALLVPDHSSWMHCTTRRWTRRWSLRIPWGATLGENRWTIALKENSEGAWWRHQRRYRRNRWVGTWWRRKHWWRLVFSADSYVCNFALKEMHKIVGSEAGTRRRSGVPQQMVNEWPQLAWSSSFFTYICSPELLALATKSLMHVADSRPPSHIVTRSPCDEISLLESPSTLLKLMTLIVKPEVWLSLMAGDLLYWC